MNKYISIEFGLCFKKIYIRVFFYFYYMCKNYIYCIGYNDICFFVEF